ncbi:MAG: alpha/beta hydrolase family protein [Gordonia sp. (in: high G+C Gram-positive bacteria)]|uniref:alpha/beta hydrolase n=1 Tax=Gordonia sp. (in: high G+C Gram-positive bacteria) TaxID=84139 RepID=UPI0039E3AED8
MFSSARKRVMAGVLAAATLAGTAAATIDSPAEARGCNGGSVESVHSNAMHRNVPVCIVSADRSGAPTLYMLDGLRAPNNSSGWIINTNIAQWMRGKGTNVAIPFGGGGSFYTNWEQRDPKLGLNKWETFLTRELPAYMKRNHGSDNRRNAVAGLSMSGTSALNLASRHPNFYKAVASYSGYPTVTMPGFGQGIQAAVADMGGNPTNMWGVWPAGEWAANDPFLTAGNLAGKRVYLSSGSGIGSKYDASLQPLSPKFNAVHYVQMVPLEVAASGSTRIYSARLATVPGVKLTTNITPDGAHWWDYWQSNFKESWYTTFRPAFFGR